MEQVKIFEKSSPQDLEVQMNKWLSENSEKIIIVDRKFSGMMAGEAGVYSKYSFSVAIFYTNKH